MRSRSASDLAQAAEVQRLKDEAQKATDKRLIGRIFKLMLSNDQQYWESFFLCALQNNKPEIVRRKLGHLLDLLSPMLENVKYLSS